MDFNFNSYAIVLLICGFTSILLGSYLYNRGGIAVKWFSVMMCCNSIWSITYGLELASQDLEQIKFLINIEYIGISSIPLCWFLFCLSFCGKECWYKKKQNVLLILIIPIITVIMVWTNAYHHFHYKSLSLYENGPFPMVKIEPGWWYRVFTIYFYLLLASGCYLIIQKFRTLDPIYKRQNYSIVLAASIPWVANILYLLGFRPFNHLDLTPFAFILTCGLIAIGIFRFHLFDIIPIAREKVLELVRDGFFVLDQKNRVIDYNQSIKSYISTLKSKRIIGTSIETIFPNQNALYEKINSRSSGKIDLILPNYGDYLHVEADILFLDDNKISNDFSIIKLQDVTNYKKEAIKTRAQADELEKLNQLKDRIFSIIAHDLRGPLVNLSEILKMIMNNQVSIEEFRNLSPTLSKDIIYTTDLLENILHWSRSQLKGFGIKKELFNLRNLINNEIGYHLPAATLKKITIVHDVFPCEMVYADILMIQIVIRNLLNNAIKFCNENCEIHITASYQRNGMMLVCIKDNGVGIPTEILNRLFKEDSISTRGTYNEKGTGLGLLVCNDFMKKNDGSIYVDSLNGHGTKFCISIPTTNKE